jgi:DHA1 family bicyclomycin/chloramphenicol resistance-like MFS transporter
MPQSNRWIPVLLTFYNLTANLSNDIYIPTMPVLDNIFHTTTTAAQLTMTAWFAGVATPQLIFGPISDRYGRRPLILCGAVCFVVATLFCFIARNIETLIIARFFQGVGVCSLNVATFSILSDLYKYQGRIKVMSYIYGCSAITPLLGPILGGYILEYLGWRYTFVVIFIFGIISLSGIWYRLNESNTLMKKDALYFKNIYINYLILIRNIKFLKVLIPYCLILGGTVAHLTGAPFIIIEQMHIHPKNFGYTQVPLAVSFFLGSVIVGYIEKYISIEKLLIAGFTLLLFASTVLTLFSLLVGNQLWLLIACMAIYSLGAGLCTSPLLSKIMSLGVHVKGATAAFLGFGMALSCVLSSSLTSLLYNNTLTSIAIIIFVFILCAVLIFFDLIKIRV